MLGGKRILIINESTNLRYFLNQILSREGAEVTEAGSGREGLTLAQGKRVFDLILVELGLSDVPGLEVLHRLVEHNTESAVVILIGQRDTRSVVAALQSGADGYVDRDEIGVGGNISQFLTTLQQAMSHRAASLEMAKIEQLKSDFFAMVTHDLRNPAGSIKTAILMLLEDETGPLNQEQRALIEIAKMSADKLINLINNYLDYARIDAGFLELVTERTDLRRIIEASARPAVVEAQHRHQTVSLLLPDTPVHAWVDAHRLGHVMDNLLSNAIKYTPHGGNIDVCLSIDVDHAVIQVSDTGYGIPPGEIPAIFERFRRTRNPAVQGIRGTGLGLLIVKEIVERHGGTVEAESEGVPGKGSVFMVRLPLQSAAKPRGSQSKGG